MLVELCVAEAAAATEIDAMRPGSNKSRQDFTRDYKGRCFGCGQKGHSKRDAVCPAKGKTCAYCFRTGHVEAACIDKYTGRERGQGLKTPSAEQKSIRSTSVDLPDEEPPSSTTSRSPPAPTVDPALSAHLSALLEQQQKLAVDIAALRQQGF